MMASTTGWQMQAPDGTDWLEYIAQRFRQRDQHTRGVMNHISLGVSDIQIAYKQLVAN